MLQKVHDLVKFFLGAVHASHVFERDVRAFALFEDLRLGFADVEDLASSWCTTAKATHQEHPHHHHQAQENDPRQDLTSPFVGWIVPQLKPVLLLQLFQIGLVSFSIGDVHGRVSTCVQGLKQLGFRLVPGQAVSNRLGEEQIGGVAIVRHTSDLPIFDHLLELGPLHLLLASRFPEHDHGQQEHGHDGVHPVKVHLTAWFSARGVGLAGRVAAGFFLVHVVQFEVWCWAGASPHNSSKA